MELADTDEEEKKLKKIIKANEAKLERQRELKKIKAKPSYFNQEKIGSFGQGFGQGASGGSSNDYMYSFLKSKGVSVIYKPTSGELKGARTPRRRTTSSVLTARGKDTWQETAGFKTLEQEVVEEEDNLVGAGEIVAPVSNF